jgi:hypothetical protein
MPVAYRLLLDFMSWTAFWRGISIRARWATTRLRDSICPTPTRPMAAIKKRMPPKPNTIFQSIGNERMAT